MNILFLDQFSDLGGAQRCLVDLAPALLDRGWPVHVAAPGSGALRNRIEALGGSYYQIHARPYQSGGKSIRDLLRFPIELPALAREIAGLAEKCRADVLYVNGPRLLPAAALAARDKANAEVARLRAANAPLDPGSPHGVPPMVPVPNITESPPACRIGIRRENSNKDLRTRRNCALLTPGR